MDQRLKRGIYLKILKQARTKNRSAIVQQGTIQLEKLLSANELNISFALNSNDGSVPKRNSEKRLDQNDAFVVTSAAIFLKEDHATKHGIGMLETYPNTTRFAEAANAAIADLLPFWNSRLNVKVGDTVYVEGLDMNKCLIIPTTQQSAATNWSERRDNEGYIDIEPIITLEGQAKNDLTLKVPSWNGGLVQKSTSAAGLGIYAVLKLDGFLVTGGSGLGAIR